MGLGTRLVPGSWHLVAIHSAVIELLCTCTPPLPRCMPLAGLPGWPVQRHIEARDLSSCVFIICMQPQLAAKQVRRAGWPLLGWWAGLRLAWHVGRPRTGGWVLDSCCAALGPFPKVRRTPNRSSTNPPTRACTLLLLRPWLCRALHCCLRAIAEADGCPALQRCLI